MALDTLRLLQHIRSQYDTMIDGELNKNANSLMETAMSIVIELHINSKANALSSANSLVKRLEALGVTVPESKNKLTKTFAGDSKSHGEHHVVL